MTASLSMTGGTMAGMQWATIKKGLVVGLCLLFVGLVGLIRYHTGPELALSLFYLPAIVMGSWAAGRWAGLLISFGSAGSWLLADISMGHTFSHPAIPFINETFRLIVFVILALMTWKLKEMFEAQKRLARTDPLTHLANRRFFFELAELECKRARRHGYPLSVLYLDLDNFKSVNDCFGHQAGDSLLRRSAAILEHNTREIDILGRVGGDEFCILLVDTTPEESRQIAEKLKHKLLTLMKDGKYAVAVSIGVAVFFEVPPKVADMIHAADDLMYWAKRERRGRIVCRVFGFQGAFEKIPMRKV